MKKTVAAILSIAVLLLSFTVPVHADVVDCRDVPQAQKELVGMGDSDTMIRIYNGYFLPGFAAGDSLENLTSEKYVLEEVLVTCEKEERLNVECFAIRNGVADRLSGLEKAARVFAEYTDEQNIRKLEQKTKAEIRSVVCLCGEPSHNGIYIYYVTDQGDFVLFKEYAISEKTYFFPLEEFTAAAAEYQEEKTKNLYDENGNERIGADIRFEDVKNVGKYELSLNEKNGWVIVAVCIVAFLVLAVLLLVLVRRKFGHSGER